jgi:hypothetical protein
MYSKKYKCNVLMYLRGNLIGTDDDDGRRTTHFKSLLHMTNCLEEIERS